MRSRDAVIVTDACQDCGKRLWGPFKKDRVLHGITVSIRECPQCKTITTVVPKTDWLYMLGDDSQWD